MRKSAIFLFAAVLVGVLAPVGSQAAETPVTFAVIGDYGMNNAAELAVSNLVKGWTPAYVIATGDDYYSAAGGTGTGKYDISTGKYYCPYLAGAASGSNCTGNVAVANAFFPVLGNHDYSDAGAGTDTVYRDYFNLPGSGFANTSGNERYYDFVSGPIHFFMLNSNTAETAGTAYTSTQALWLKAQLAASASAWNIVVFHHPPYSSDGSHGNTAYMQWPFTDWGADVVLSGHAHTYERLSVSGTPYIVNGLGGAGIYSFGTPVNLSGVTSVYRFNGTWGAQKATATSTTLTMSFIDVNGVQRDTFTLNSGVSVLSKLHLSNVVGSASKVKKNWTATVTVTVHDEAHALQSGVTVTGSWSGGGTGTSSCTTGAGGTCQLVKSGLKTSVPSLTVSVTNLVKASYSYASADNEAATSVTVYRP